MKRRSQLLLGSEVVTEQRNGLSKELPEVGSKLFEPSGSWYEDNRINSSLEDRLSLLSQPRIQRDNVLSVAEWDNKKRKAVLTKKKGKEHEVYGHHQDGRDYLFPEEALFLIETNSLILFHESIEVSVEVAYALLLDEYECSLDKYKVFSHLSRHGYRVLRHEGPSRVPPLNPRETNQNHTVSEQITVVPQASATVAKQSLTQNVITIDDSSSDSSDIVFIEITKEKEKEKDKGRSIIIDEDSNDSVILINEEKRPVEIVSLPHWPFVYWEQFLGISDLTVSDDNPSYVMKVNYEDIVGRCDTDILDDIPNIKGTMSTLLSPDFRLLPPGIKPKFNEYRINLSMITQSNYNTSDYSQGFQNNQEYHNYYQNENRGYYQTDGYQNSRSGFQNNYPHNRGNRMFSREQMREYYQLKNAAYSMLKYAAALLGRPWIDRPRGRGRRFYQRRQSCQAQETIELSDDDDVSQKDVKPQVDVKPINLGSPASSAEISVCSDSVKLETNDKSKVESAVLKIKDGVKTEKDDSAIKIEEKQNTPAHCTQSTSTSVKEETQDGCKGSKNCEKETEDENKEPQTLEPVNDSSIAVNQSNDVTIDVGQTLSSVNLSDSEIRSENVVEESMEIDISVDECTKSNKLLSINLTEKKGKRENIKSQGSNDDNGMESSKECVSELKERENDIKSRKENEEAISGEDTITLMEVDIVQIPADQKSNAELGDNYKSNNLKNNSESVKGTSIDDPKKQMTCEKGTKRKNESLEVEEALSEAVSGTSTGVLKKQLTREKGTKRKNTSLEVVDAVSEASTNITEKQLTCKKGRKRKNLSLEVEDDVSEDISGVTRTEVPKKQLTCEKGRKRRNESLEVEDTISEVDEVGSEGEGGVSSERAMISEPAEQDNEVTSWRSLKAYSNCSTALLKNDYLQVEPLVQPQDCKSLSDVLSVLRLFEPFDEDMLEVGRKLSVSYDVYLPTVQFRKTLREPPNFRLVILEFEDSFPTPGEMTYLRKKYQDQVQFLFAIVLRDSVAFYLFDNVSLPLNM